MLDLCAGAGGKTLAMAAAMDNRGQIFAYDSDRARLAPIYDRLKRAGARNVQVRPPEPEALDDLVGQMDLVLVDAPCTGTGTWRRRPDAKWKLTPEQVADRVARTGGDSRRGGRFVKPGGRSSTSPVRCCPTRTTGRSRRSSPATPISCVADNRARFARTFGDAAPLPGVSSGSIWLSPSSAGTDGFFFCLLRRPSEHLHAEGVAFG